MNTQFHISKELFEILKSEVSQKGLDFIKEWQPDLFGLEDGWYKHTNKKHPNWLMFYDSSKDKIYGFSNDGNWLPPNFDVENQGYIQRNCEPATESEVSEMLIAEANKRGFIKGNKVIFNKNEYKITSYSLLFHYSENKLYAFNGVWSFPIFHNGQWAEIIPEPKKMTVSEICNELGYDVEIVKE